MNGVIIMIAIIIFVCVAMKDMILSYSQICRVFKQTQLEGFNKLKS